MNNDSLDFIFRPSGDITQEVTVARMESLRKAASRAQPPDRVIGGKIRTTPDGWTLEINQRAVGSTHPWKVTANGDNTVTVAAGNIQGFKPNPAGAIGSSPANKDRFFAPFNTIAVKFEEVDDFEITDSGYIYAKVNFFDEEDEYIEGTQVGDSFEVTGNLYRPKASISLFLSTTDPDSFDPSLDDTGTVTDAYFLIAEVALSETDVASVEYQYLTHNPIVQLDDIKALFS